MRSETFISKVAADAEARGYAVSLREVPKINGSKLGLSLEALEGTPVATFYEEHFQQMAAEGFSVTDMTNRLLDESMKNPDLGEIDRLLDRDYILSHAELCVCKTDWNEQFLADTPNMTIEGTDLSAYARISLGDGANVVPRAEQLKTAGITPEELLNAASENSRRNYKIESLDAKIAELLGEEPPAESRSGAYVLSNNSAIHGASAITDPETRAKARDLVGADDVYIIPSSIHECLVMPAANMRPEEVNAMIREINQAEVKPEERLSDHAYKFDGQKLSEVKTMDRELVAGRSR